MVSKEIGKHIGKQILPINDSNNVQFVGFKNIAKILENNSISECGVSLHLLAFLLFS